MKNKAKSVNKDKKMCASNKKNDSKETNYLNSLNSKGRNNTLRQKKYLPGKKTVVIWSDFNTLPFSDKRFKKDWIEERIRIFMRFTLKSLKAQTNQDFLALIKYEDKSEKIVSDALSHYPKLPANIRFVPKSEYEKKVIERIKGFEYLYLLRLDSDDMYHKSFIQQLYDFKHDISTEAIINQNGYIYDSLKNQLARFPHKSPNYYTLIYEAKDYLAGKRYRIPGGHPNVIKLLNHEIIKKPNYIRLVHSINDSSTFRLANKKNIINDKNKIKEILSNFMK